MNQAIPESDCAALIRHRSCGDSVRRGYSGTCPKSHAAKGRYGHRLEGHGCIRDIVCGMADRAGQAALMKRFGVS